MSNVIASHLSRKMAESSLNAEQTYDLRRLLDNMSAEAQLDEERRRHQAVEVQLDDLRWQKNLLGDILTELEERVPELEATIKDKEVVICELRRDLQKAEQQAGATDAYLTQLEQSHQDLENENARLRRQAAGHVKDIKSLKAEVEAEKECAQGLERSLHVERQKTRRVTDSLMSNIYYQRAVQNLLHKQLKQEISISLSLSALPHPRLADFSNKLRKSSSPSCPKADLHSVYPFKLKKPTNHNQTRKSKMSDFDTDMMDVESLDSLDPLAPLSLNLTYPVDEDVIMDSGPAMPAFESHNIHSTNFTLCQTEDIQMAGGWPEVSTNALNVHDDDVEMIDVDNVNWENDMTILQQQNASAGLQKTEPILTHPVEIPPRKKRSRDDSEVGVLTPPKRRKSMDEVHGFQSKVQGLKPDQSTHSSSQQAKVDPTKQPVVDYDTVLESRLKEAEENMQKLTQTTQMSAKPVDFRPKKTHIRGPRNESPPQQPSSGSKQVPLRSDQTHFQSQPQSFVATEVPKQNTEMAPETKLSSSRARVAQVIRKVRANWSWKQIWEVVVGGFLRLLQTSTSDLLLVISCWVIISLACAQWCQHDWMGANDIPIAIATELRNKRVMEEGWMESFVYDMFEWLGTDRSLMG